jgi:beta-phosphoglucomutase family hydrolase
MKLQVDEQARGLIFDVDGTLADTMPMHYEAWKDVIHRIGHQYPEETFYEFAGVPTKQIVPLINERYGLDLDPVKTVEEKEKAFLGMMHLVRPIEPVARIVRRYHGTLPMGLGTGGRRKIAELTLETIGLWGYFDVLVGAEDVENHKPAPDTFLKCAELLRVAPQYCQVFEDGEKGLEAARRAGMIATDVRLFL